MTKRKIRARVPQYLSAFQIKPQDIDSILEAMIADDAAELAERNRARTHRARQARHHKRLAKRERALLAAADARQAARPKKPAGAQFRGSAPYLPKDGIASIADRFLCGLTPGIWHAGKLIAETLGDATLRHIGHFMRSGWIESRRMGEPARAHYRLTAKGEAERGKREKLVAARLRAREEGRALDLRFKSQRDAITGETSGTRIKRRRRRGEG